MRSITIAAALVCSFLLVACQGEEAAPLTLEQRVVGEAEAPGSEPDPEETPVTVTGLEELEAEFAQGPPVDEDDLRAIEEAGFVSAVINTRFFPSEPGGEHIPGTPHVVTSVYEFESEEGANAAVDVAHAIGLRSCPETCAYEIAEFEPAGVPDAKGVEAIATQESIDRIGDDIQPDARYSVYFADGPIAYEVTMFGPPDEVSRQQVEDIAEQLYERVEGAPLP